MATTPDAPSHDDSPPQIAALHREVSALMHRWQQAGVVLHDVTMVLATVGCQALGHALGDVASPEGPEILQDMTRHLQRQAEACYFQHWRGDTSSNYPKI
jgi:hypothetical protein